MKPKQLSFGALLALLLFQSVPLSAELRRIEVLRRDDFGAYERIIGRAFFAVDPALAANRGITDVVYAPRNANGQVEFSGDLLYFRPKGPAKTRGAVFLEIVNRGRDQALGLMSAAVQRDLAPENWDLGDRFLLEQGFSVAFLGWQFNVRPSQGLTFQAPGAPVEGIVRESHIEQRENGGDIAFALSYCAADPKEKDAKLTFRSRIDDTARVLARERWRFEAGGCVVQLQGGAEPGIYDAIYHARNSPVAGLGLAAIRDFASYLKYGPKDAALREDPALVQRVIGFGYSQSGRFLREFVRDGFNSDEKGRAAFDGLMISSAGAGGGSFNHRFAMPGEAGNSVLSILRPVDLPPFDDEGLLAGAVKAHVVPKIFYTFSSTEYWARAGSLTHTTREGNKDVSLAATSRLYFIPGTPHASGPLLSIPEARAAGFQYRLNFAQQRWVLRALLLDLDDWVRAGAEPPASRYPTVSKGELLSRMFVRFPKIPSFPFADYMPSVWAMDYGSTYERTRIITKEPPGLEKKLVVLVPQVDVDGNDVSGIRIPEVAVPIGTYTGWNIQLPQLRNLDYLAGLVGSFEPFARTREEREKSGDPRLSIAERYSSRQEYLDRVQRAVRDLVAERFMLAGDAGAVMQRAERMWDRIVTATQGR
jgi:alpha/beta hydrolase family protein